SQVDVVVIGPALAQPLNLPSASGSLRWPAGVKGVVRPDKGQWDAPSGNDQIREAVPEVAGRAIYGIAPDARRGLLFVDRAAAKQFTSLGGVARSGLSNRG